MLYEACKEMSMETEKPPAEWLEMFQKMIHPMAFSMPGLLMPGFRQEDLERKIAELGAVREWLNGQVVTLDWMVKALEYQRSLLQATDPHQDDASGHAGQ